MLNRANMKIHEATIRKIRVIYEEIKGPDTEIVFSKTSQSDNGFCPKKSYKVDKLYKVIFPVKIEPSVFFDLVPLELNSKELWPQAPLDKVKEKLENLDHSLAKSENINTSESA